MPANLQRNANDGLVAVDPDTTEISDTIPVSDEAYPLVKGAIYDSTNHTIRIAEGRKSVITGYSTIAGKWIDTLAVPVGKHVIDGEDIGGRPAGLAYDSELGEVHVLVQPTLRDDWSKSIVISFRTDDTKYVGEPIGVGENARWWMTTGASMDTKKIPNPLASLPRSFSTLLRRQKSLTAMLLTNRPAPTTRLTAPKAQPRMRATRPVRTASESFRPRGWGPRRTPDRMVPTKATK